MPAMLELLIGLIGAFFWEILLRTPTLKLVLLTKNKYTWKRFFDFRGDLHILKSVIQLPKRSIRESDIIVEHEILQILGKKVNQVIEGPHHFDFEQPTSNLIIVGSPRYNEYAALVQKYYEVNFEYVFDSYEANPAEKILKIISRYGDEYVSSFDLKTNRSRIGIDYGILFIAKLKNKKRIFWISGIHGAGTIGVFKHFKTSPNIFLNKLPENGSGKSWLFRIQYDKNKEESFEMIEDVELIGESKICIPRKIKQKPKVLICDFGNVIMLFDRSRTYRAIGHWFRISHKKVATIIEGTTLRQKYEKGELNDKEFYNEVIALFKTSFEMPYELFSEFWGDIFWPNGNVIEALNLLQKEVKLVLLSNTNSLHFANVKEHYGDIVSLFEDRLILSYKEKIAKPDKRIFEKALQVAGADITFSDCIYVDDKVEYVNVANRLGMKGIVFYSYPQFVYSIRELGLYIP